MENDWNSEEKRHPCAECERDIRLGEDALLVEEGVVGYRGLVSLEKPLWFCGVRCMAVFFQDEQHQRDSPKRPALTDVDTEIEHDEESNFLKWNRE